jgi:transposase
MTSGRVEVITSVQRRRRWSLAEKEQLVAASLEPDARVSAVARDAGIHPSQLCGRPPEGFAPVRITPAAASAGLPGSGTIEIELASGARMRITGAVDAAMLTAAVRALVHGRRR